MSAALLTVEAVSKTFGGIKAVKDISFSLMPGEILGLIGPNGAGKTTCFNVITGFYTPTAGRVAFRGVDVTGSAPFAIAQRGIVRSFQKTNVLKRLTVFENVLAGHYLAARQSLWDTFFPRAHVTRAERAVRESAAAIVSILGLERRMNAPAAVLSCGELRLLEVAVALAAKPAVLMLDEPAAGLNNQEALEFGKVLQRVRATMVEAILLVEHNMSLVMSVSDRVIVMNFGEKLAEGTPAEIQGDARVIEAYLGKAKGMSAAARPVATGTAAEPLLRLENVRVAYGKAEALHGVSLDVQAGEVVALIGANGAGKSTALRAISGLLRPASGRIAWQGADIGGWPAEKVVAAGVAHCPEERHVWSEMSVRENLMLGAYLVKSKHEVERRLAIAFHRFARLRERERQLAGTLSGGEQQMLAIARALMSEPALLMLDEPSLGLAPKMADEVYDVVREINRHGVTVLVVEQNIHNALAIASRAYVFETGHIKAEDSSANLLADPELLHAYLGG